MKKKLSPKDIFQNMFIRLGIKEIFTAAGWGKEISRTNLRLINRISFAAGKKANPTIAIITPNALNKLFTLREKPRRQILDNMLNNDVVFLILSNSVSIPTFLKIYGANTGLSVAAAEYDAYYLKSLLQGLIREKFQGTVSVHGVILEAMEKGILITGASGIGKTTAALKIAAKDYYWVADDVAVIKRNSGGELIAGGHKKINLTLHTETTGIIAVSNVLAEDRIKENTKLAAVVEVEKKSITSAEITKGEKEILGVKLICLHVSIPSTGFFNENLLKKSIKQLF